MPIENFELPERQTRNTFWSKNKIKVFFVLLLLVVLCVSVFLWLFNGNIISFNSEETKDYKEELVTRSDDRYQWIVDRNSYIPSNLVIAGVDSDNSTVSVIRSKNDDNEMVIGKYTSRKESYIYYKESEKKVYSIEFLSALNYLWKNEVSTNDRVYADDEKIRYVCRVKHYATIYHSYNIPGFVDESGECKYSYGNDGYESDNFEVLSVP